MMGELQNHAEECAKLAVSAPTAALREQYAELSKVWAELQRVRDSAGNGEDRDVGAMAMPKSCALARAT
jgi:hypothetical protein